MRKLLIPLILLFLVFNVAAQTFIAPGGAIYDGSTGAFLGFTNRNTGAEDKFRHSTGALTGQVRTGQATAPTCTTNCGTSPSVAGTDSAMIVTMGATGSPASGWVVTFNGTWAAAPACSVQMAKAGMVVGKQALTAVSTTTTLTVVTNGTAPANTDIYAVQCLGVQ